MAVKRLWADKYRPKTLDEYLFQDEAHKAIIQKYIQEKSIPHLMFAGHRGTGKTALALLLKDELGIEDCDFLTLNASDDNSVEVIRTKVKNFISTFALGPFKIVFMDEADGLTVNAQEALKSMMSDGVFSENARFIMTCNRPQKIIPEIQDSRCHVFNFKSLSKDDMLTRLAEVLTAEKVKVANIEVLDTYVNMAYPDMRKLLMLAEQNTIDGTLAAEPVSKDTSIEYKLEILSLLDAGNWEAIRNIVCENVDGDEWIEVYRFMYNYLHEVDRFKDVKKWKQGIIIIADHLYKHDKCADNEINFAACAIRLTDI